MAAPRVRLLTPLLILVAVFVLCSTRAAAKPRHKRGGCPAGMVRVGDYCVDRYEAPNRKGARPLEIGRASCRERV